MLSLILGRNPLLLFYYQSICQLWDIKKSVVR